MKSVLVGLVAVLLSSGVTAAERLPQAIEACATLRRDAERLACFDKAVAALQAGETTTAVTAENMFGASTETARRPQEPQREELQQISGIVTSLRTTDGGMIILELDNGQVWRQQDSDVRMMVAKGDTVTIVRASMGTFRIADKSGRFARFKRVR
jgi:hypothetical protein